MAKLLGIYMGKFTSYQYNGNSVIDYCIMSEEQLSNVIYFHVDDPVLRLSDHSKISVEIIANFHKSKDNIKLENFPTIFKWGTESSRLFAETLNSDDVKNQLNAIDEKTFNSPSGVDKAICNLSQVIIQAANISLKRKSSAKKKRKQNKKWFDINLVKLRKSLDEKAKKFAKNPNDAHLRGNFFRCRKHYSKLCKVKHRKYKADMINKLDNLHENDPKTYWSILNDLKDDNSKSDSIFAPDEMMEHFSVLNKIPNRYAERVSEIEEALSQVNHISTFTNLYFLTMAKEIDNCLGSLKTNKSTGLDCISNEMLKCGETILWPCIFQIFNTLMQFINLVIKLMHLITEVLLL